MQIMGCMLGARLRVLPKKWGFLKSVHRNEDGLKLVHAVSIKKDSKLAALVNMQQLEVNSIHAEALSKMDEKFVSARAPDGVIEAIEHPDKTFMLGVQWHPEYFLDANSKHLSICRGLVEAALAKRS
jgi:putative glutamine amidotransferase